MGGWQETPLSDLLNQKKRQISIEPDTEYSLVTVSKTGEVKLREKKMGAVISAKKGFAVRVGDFIYSRLSVHTGAFGIVPEELDGALVTNEMPCFEIDETKILPSVLIRMLGLPSFLWQLRQLTQGIGRVRIKESMMLSLKFAIPSIIEQEKIVEHFKSIESEDRELKYELRNQQNLLKKLHQQILQEAIEGKLTADWRASGPSAEPAQELLKRIAAEKAELVNAKKIKKQKPLPTISDAERPFELPGGWEWCRLGEATYGFQYGTSSKSAKSGDVPVLRMGNIQNGKIEWNDLVYSSDHEDLVKFDLEAGDLLFNRTNSRELVGKTAMFDGLHEAIYAGYLVRFRMAGGAVPEFANLVMNSLLHRDWCDEVKTDALGQSNINATKLSLFKFPLPPIDEQHAIVSKAGHLLAICDELETQTLNNQANADALMQAVLREAFEQGSTEPDYAQ